MRLHIAIASPHIKESLIRYAELVGCTMAQDESADYVLSNEASALILSDHTKQPVARLPMPIMLPQLATSLRAVAEQPRSHADMLMIGKSAYALDVAKRLVVRQGVMVMELTQKETEMLARIVSAGEAGVEKEVLLQEVWGYHADAKSRTIEAHLYRLRQKLAEIGADFPAIAVMEGKCFVG